MRKRLFQIERKALGKIRKAEQLKKMKENNVKYRQKGTYHTLNCILFLNTTESY